MIHDVPTGHSAADRPAAADAANHGEADQGQADRETVYRPALDEMRENMGQFRISEAGNRWSMKTPDGAVYGPVDYSEMEEWSRQGRVSAACLVQMEGQSHWQSALVLFPHLAAVRTASPGQRNPQARRTARQHSRHGRHRSPGGLRRNNGVTVLILGIVGIFMVVMPVFSLMAAIMGQNERSRIAAGEVSGEDRVALDIGFYLGVLGTGIGLLMFFGCCIVTGNI